MKQKRIDNELYVYSMEPYVIRDDTDADVIYVQEELIDEYKALNPSINNFAKKNFYILSIYMPPYNEYKNLPDGKGYAFMTETPTAENIANSLSTDGIRGNEPEQVENIELEKPTTLYLVFPKNWEEYDSETDQILKPVVIDVENGGEMGIWYESDTPYITVNNKEYKVMYIQLGKGTYTIEF